MNSASDAARARSLDEPAILAGELIDKIGGPWVSSKGWPIRLLLGPEFDESLEQARMMSRRLRPLVKSAVLAVGEAEMKRLARLSAPDFAEDAALAPARSLISTHVEKQPRWVRLVVGTPNAAADYVAWVKANTLAADEAFLLMVGLNPLANFQAALNDAGPDCPISQSINQSHRIFLRAVDPDTSSGLLTAPALAARIAASGFQTTLGFKRMLRVMQWRKNWTAQDATPSDSEAVKSRGALETLTEPGPAAPEGTAPDTPGARSQDHRELKAMARLITALAIEHYGYDPTKERSNVAASISSTASLHGIDLSKKTVLKYLRLGAGQIDKGTDASSDRIDSKGNSDRSQGK